MSDELLTVKQTAEYLKLSDRSIHKLITDKKLYASKVGLRAWRIRKADIDAFLCANSNVAEREIGYDSNA